MLPRLSPTELVQREAVNVIRQYDHVVVLIGRAALPGVEFSLEPEILQDLNRIALDGIESDGGRFRPGRVIITNSEHRPPAARDIESLVEEMCLYVNRSWSLSPPVHLAASVM